MPSTVTAKVIAVAVAGNEKHAALAILLPHTGLPHPSPIRLRGTAAHHIAPYRTALRLPALPAADNQLHYTTLHTATLCSSQRTCPEALIIVCEAGRHPPPAGPGDKRRGAREPVVVGLGGPCVAGRGKGGVEELERAEGLHGVASDERRLAERDGGRCWQTACVEGERGGRGRERKGVWEKGRIDSHEQPGQPLASPLPCPECNGNRRRPAATVRVAHYAFQHDLASTTRHCTVLYCTRRESKEHTQ